MKLWTHRYQITPSGSLAQRSGFLIKLENADTSVGFADLMSWPELEEKDIGEELAAILEGKPTLLGQRVLALAKEDAHARKNNFSFWNTELKVPQSHYLVGNLDDLTHFKIASLEKNPEFKSQLILKAKVNGPLDSKVLLSLQNPLRLDFNEKGQLDRLIEFFSDQALRQKIDFLEDPFPADSLADWQHFKACYPDISLYGDHALHKNPKLFAACDGVVLKPASRCELNPLKAARLSGKKICVTHSMGHPLGHSVAASFAALNSVNSTGLWPSPTLHGAEFNWNEKSEGFGYGWPISHFEKLSWNRERFTS